MSTGPYRGRRRQYCRCRRCRLLAVIWWGVVGGVAIAAATVVPLGQLLMLAAAEGR